MVFCFFPMISQGEKNVRFLLTRPKACTQGHYQNEASFNCHLMQPLFPMRLTLHFFFPSFLLRDPKLLNKVAKKSRVNKEAW